MDFGHNRHHTHHHRNDDEAPPPPQPTYYPPNEFAPPPPHHHQPSPPHHHQPPPFHHQPEFGGPSPPGYAAAPPPSTYGYGSHQPEYGSSNYAPPPQHVTHVGHQSHEGHHHGFEPHLPSVHRHQPHPELGELSRKPTMKIYCKADYDFVLAIRDGKVVLAPADPSDQYQRWYKDEKFSTRVKDSVGFPSFSLVNKATGQAIKHAIGASHPVQLTPYKPDHLDESILWTESSDTGDDYRAIRMVNNIKLNLDAFNDGKSGVHNGTIIGLWEWNKGNNQRWKIEPY